MKSNLIKTKSGHKICGHSRWEVESAFDMDGICPICQTDELEASKSNAHKWWLEFMRVQKELNDIRDST